MRALITAIAVPAQRRRAALDQRPEDASMLAGEPRPVPLQKPIAVSAQAAVVILEGVGAARRELTHLLDAVVWVQSDVGEAERRGNR